MAIEIREMIIKTVVHQDGANELRVNEKNDIAHLRREILEECRKMIKEDKFQGRRSR